MTKDQIRAIFLGAGFTIKQGQDDLRPYVYDAAYCLLSASIADTAGAACVDCRENCQTCTMYKATDSNRTKAFDEFCNEHIDGQDTVSREWLWNFVNRWVAATPASSVADAAGAKPVAWRVRGYSQFRTGTPSAWRYVDGSTKPRVTDAPNCDIEPLYIDDIAGAMTREDWKELYDIAYDHDSFERFMRTAEANIAEAVANAAATSESNWAFEAAKINLDRIHAVVMEFGCRPQDTVVDWLRERLTLANPVVWAVYCGLGEMRPISVHFKREEALKVASEIKSNTEVRPLYAAPSEKKDTSEAERHHKSFDDGLNKKLDAAESSDRRRFTCAARKQGTAGGNYVADCDYPSCGCDQNTDLETEIFMRKNYGWTNS